MEALIELTRNFPDLDTLDENIESGEGLDLYRLANEIKIHCVKKALSMTNSNVANAARILKMKRTTLVEFLKSNEIDKTLI